MAMYASMAWDMMVAGVEAEIQQSEEYTKNIEKLVYKDTNLDSQTIKTIISFLDSCKDFKESQNFSN